MITSQASLKSSQETDQSSFNESFFVQNVKHPYCETHARADVREHQSIVVEWLMLAFGRVFGVLGPTLGKHKAFR